MSTEQYYVTQGSARSIVVTLRDAAGEVVVDSTGAEVVASTVWRGGGTAALFAPATAWADPTLGTITVTVSAAQTAALVPGTYELRTTLTAAGADPVDAYRCRLTIESAPGGVLSRPSLVSPSYAAANITGFDGSNVGCLQLLRDATGWLNRATDRVLPLSVQDEMLDPGRNRVARLREYPVETLTLYTGLVVGLTVTNTTLIRAKVTLTAAPSVVTAGRGPAGLTLSGYSAGVPATSTLTFAANPTLGAVAAAVDALGSGWSATTAHPDFPSIEINPDFGARGVPATYRIHTDTVTRYDLDAETGDVVLYSDYPTSHRGSNRGTVRAAYTAGYAEEAVPDDLARGACIVARALAQRSDYGIVSQQKSGDNFAIANGDLRNLVADVVGHYRRKRVY